MHGKRAAWVIGASSILMAACIAAPENVEPENVGEAAQDLTYRGIDGWGTNPFHVDWGSTNEALLRIAPVSYADGIDAPVFWRPNARVLSNVLADQSTEELIDDRQLSAMAYGWLEFIAHDMTFTPASTGEP